LGTAWVDDRFCNNNNNISSRIRRGLNDSTAKDSCVDNGESVVRVKPNF